MDLASRWNNSQQHPRTLHWMVVTGSDVSQRNSGKHQVLLARVTLALQPTKMIHYHFFSKILAYNKRYHQA